MATTTLSPNLKLRLSSDMLPDALYNLRRIDNLGSIFQVDTNQVANLRSVTDIQIQTQDPDIGGGGFGGNLSMGTASQPVGVISMWADTININGGVLPNSDQIVTLTGVQVLTNKTLTSPILTTPNLGTPSVLVATNATGTAAGLTAGHATLAANSTAVGGITITGTPTVGQVPTATSSSTATWQTPAGGGGSGTVTSVALTVPSFLSISGSPITTSGTLAVSLSGTALPVANGGTGQTAYTDGQLLIGNTATGGLSKATLTAGSNVTITNGNGTISIASTAGGSGTVTSVAVSGGTTGLTTSGGPITTTGTITLAGTLAVANGGTGVTTSTGTGNTVLSNSPTLVTPALGTPSALIGTNITGTAAGLTAGTVTTNANLTGAVTSSGNATSLGSFTSANLSTALTDETGSGVAVFATSPTLVSPALGTPSALVGTNITGTAASLTAGTVTTNANLTGPITSVGNATSIASQTGTGTKFVVDSSPTLITPVLGVASATSISLAADPTTALQAATKQYVDSVAAGLAPKGAVLTSTTANITLSGEQTLDGVLTSASRVLVKNQSAPADNGIYLSAAGSWSRATDMDSWAEVPSAFVFIQEGTLYGDTGWTCTSDPGGTLGVTAITFVQFSGAGTYTAGANLTLTGTQFSLTASPTIIGTNFTGTGAGFTAGNVTTNANLTGAVTSVGNASSLGSFTSANLATALTDETGSGAAVFATSPTLVSPALGTPSTLVGTNITGTASSLTAGTVTTNANLTGHITSVGNAAVLGSFTSAQLATALTDETGSGANVFATSPTLVTPLLGTPTSGVATNLTGLPLTTGVTGTLPIANGGTAVTSVTTAPTASSFAGWDANSNLSANNMIDGYATTATAAGTTTLLVGSKGMQFFTGGTTQTVLLPVTSTLALGFQFYIRNDSSGAVTVQSSGANNVQVMAASSQATFTCILITGTTAASWSVTYVATAASGTVTSVAATVPAFLSISGSPITTSGTLALSLSGTALPIANGGTSVTSIPTTASASAFSAWDANVNLPAAGFIEGYTTTAAAAGTLTLVVGSNQRQIITGTAGHTIKMPVASTLTLGQSWKIVNAQTTAAGTLTINSSGNSGIFNMNPMSSATVTCILTSGTSSSSWLFSEYSVASDGSASANTPAFNAFAPVMLDNNTSIAATNFIPSYTTAATAGGTTSLNNNATYYRYFTGTSNQTVTLPTVANYATVQTGRTLCIVNNSTGILTVNSSGANLVLSMAPGTQAFLTVILNTGTTAASWGITSYSRIKPVSQTQISRLRSAATSLTSTTTVNVCNSTTKLTLTAGDWLIYGTVGYTAAATTTVTLLNAAISKTSATLPAADTSAVPTAGEYLATQALPTGTVPSGDVTITLQPVPVSLTASTDFYLVANGTFGTSTLSVFGSMHAIAV